MKKNCSLSFVFLVLFMVCVGTSAKNNIQTLQVAEIVLNKGMDEIDLGPYPGILLMHGMSELSLIHKDKRFLNEAVEIYKKYSTREIKGRGSFISYEVGGNGAAYLFYKGVADILKEQVADGAKRMVENQKKTNEGIIIPQQWNDRQWPENQEVFIDILFGTTPFLLYSGLALNRFDYIDIAVHHTLELFRILRDQKTGLVHQDRGKFGQHVITEDNWSRGNGWAGYSLALLVRDLPVDYPRKQEIDNLAISFFNAVLNHQDKNGLWHQEMTDKESYIETSGSGLLLFGLGIMVEKGLMDNRYKKNIKKGIKGYLDYIGSEGSIENTCIGTRAPGKGTKDDFIQRKWQINDPHAFGPVVLAFTQAHKSGIQSIKPLKKKENMKQ